jgi:hypothetical protein
MPALACELALAAVEALVPRSCAQASICAAPSCSREERLSAWLEIAVRTSRPIPSPITISARKTRAAPIPRGMPRRFIRSTRGEVTEAMIPAVITGMTIVWVSESSQTRPTIAAATPTRSQEVKPASRSHLGAAKYPRASPDPASMGADDTNRPRRSRRGGGDG